jgi:hypothetical protein
VVEVSELAQVRRGVPLPLGIHWSNPKEKTFICLICKDERHEIRLIFNAGADAVDLGLPAVAEGTRWHLSAETSREVPRDLFVAGEETAWDDPHNFHMRPRSSAILPARRTD